jgi:hypothetical protein
MSTRKSLVEVTLMPLVVAVLGICGTYVITSYQSEHSRLLVEAQIRSEERRGRTEQQLKILEIFAERIVSKDVDDRQAAIRILTVLDGDLAERLATAIADDKNESPEVRILAKSVATAQATKGYSFVVLGSYKSLSDAMARAVELATKVAAFPIEVYGTENGYFAVTLGGYLPYAEADTRRGFARSNDLANDAYVRTSRLWSERLN